MTVYGSYTGEAPESTPLRTDAGPYGAAHVAAESLASGHGNTVILRPGCEYGPFCPQWSERIARLLWARRLGDLGAGGDGTCNLVYADDLIAAIVESLRMPGLQGQSFNLAMSSPPTWNEYLSCFARALGAVPVARIGARRLRIESRLLAPPFKIGEILGRRVPAFRAAIPPPITPSLLNLCAQDITLDSRKAVTALGMAWMPLAQGLKQTARSLAA
jgi:nucleoside-diphosphate-sugar epimerase